MGTSGSNLYMVGDNGTIVHLMEVHGQRLRAGRQYHKDIWEVKSKRISLKLSHLPRRVLNYLRKVICGE